MKIKTLFKALRHPSMFVRYGTDKIFFNYDHPRYFPAVYQFAKRYVAFYQGDEQGNREKNGGWRWLREFMDKSKPRVIFDVGGYDAKYALKILEIDPTVELYVFEPNPISFKNKLTPALKDKGKHIHLVNLGLSNSAGPATFYTNHDRGATDSLYQVKDGKYFHTDALTVELSTVDIYAKEHRIKQIDFLKIDTEGNDLNVIKGAEAMLKEGRIGMIQFEFSLHYTYSHTYFRDFSDYLGKFGYAVSKIMPKKVVPVENPEMERSLYAYFVAQKL